MRGFGSHSPHKVESGAKQRLGDGGGFGIRHGTNGVRKEALLERGHPGGEEVERGGDGGNVVEGSLQEDNLD